MIARLTGLISVVVVALASFAAHAQTGWYIGGEAGTTLLQDSDIDDPTGILAVLGTETSFDTGFFIGGSLGYGMASGSSGDVIRIEGELSYRQNDFDQFTIIGISLDMGGDVSALSFMANGFYDFSTGSSWMPYLGGGLGFAQISINEGTVVGIPFADDEDVVLAYQLGAGVGFQITPQLTISADYRFLGTLDPDFTDPAGIEFSTEYLSHNFGLGLRFGF